MRNIPISVVILTKNEAASIATCIKSVQDFDEIIVLDSNSEDQTQEISLGLNAQVVNFSWDKKYPKKKQWALEKLSFRNEWVLLLDADEIPTNELIGELRAWAKSEEINDYSAGDMTLDYVFAGRTLKHGHRVIKRSLIKIGAAKFPEVGDLDAPGIGEVEGHYQPMTAGKILKLNGGLMHNDLDPVRTWFDRHNKYSDWEAYLAQNKAIRKNVALNRSLQGRIFDSVPFKPLLFFLFAYIVKQGFRDGRSGFDYAFAISAYYWQIGLKTRERQRRISDGEP